MPNRVYHPSQSSARMAVRVLSEAKKMACRFVRRAICSHPSFLDKFHLELSQINHKQLVMMRRAGQRFALPAWGGRVDSPSKRETAEARNMIKKRGAYPKSGARCVRRRRI
jgi:hypothetical protein